MRCGGPHVSCSCLGVARGILCAATVCRGGRGGGQASSPPSPLLPAPTSSLFPILRVPFHVKPRWRCLLMPLPPHCFLPLPSHSCLDHLISYTYLLTLPYPQGAPSLKASCEMPASTRSFAPTSHLPAHCPHSFLLDPLPRAPLRLEPQRRCLLTLLPPCPYLDTSTLFPTLPSSQGAPSFGAPREVPGSAPSQLLYSPLAI